MGGGKIEYVVNAYNVQKVKKRRDNKSKWVTGNEGKLVVGKR